MNELANIRRIKRLAYMATGSFLVIHVAMIIMFAMCGVTPMVCVNVLSIAFYLLAPLAVHKGWLRGFFVSVYLEVLVHMTAAMLCVGCYSGFQVTLVGMAVLAFFAEYVGRSMQIRYVPGMVLALLDMLAYLGTHVWNYLHPAPYDLPGAVSFGLQIGWGLIVFLIIAIVMEIFVLSAFHFEEVMASWVVHDKLTGLHNRYYMSDHLANLAEGDDLVRCWVAMVDIDDFKRINDTYGHNCGDMVLREMASLVRSTQQAGLKAEVCRWGGEEFLLVGRHDGDLSAVCDNLDRLRRVVEGHTFWYKEERIAVTVTIGVAAYTHGTIEEWINEADQRLYEGKQSGKNRVVCA